MPAPKHPEREYFVPVSYNAPPSMHTFIAQRAAREGVSAAAFFRQIICELMKKAKVTSAGAAMAASRWPDNIVADRHESNGKWVLQYLTDEQATLCLAAVAATGKDTA